MEIHDLQVMPRDTPSPYPLPVVMDHRDGEAVIGVLPESVTLRAVGWLGNRVHATGDVPDACVDRLIDAYESDELIWDGTMGFHVCEICAPDDEQLPDKQIQPVVRWRDRTLRVSGQCHHLVEFGDTVYMCPALILHYLLDHHYRPPSQFLTAVTRGRFLTTKDLVPSPESMDEWIARHHRPETRGTDAR